jgi:hypothetical protein
MFAQASGQTPEPVSYHPERKLIWNDFAGNPDYSDLSKAAQISTTIQLRSVKVNFWTGKTRFDGSAIMYQHKSWVKPGFQNDYVLSHEQIHFDIAYIAVKKLEADINSLNVNILNKRLIDAMYKNWHSIFLLNEQTYDLMTDGGNDREMQRYYHHKVAAELKQLESNIF